MQEDEFKRERFAAAVAAKQMHWDKWVDIALDTDRQLLNLATAAIGLLAAFVTTKGVSSVSQLCFLIISGLAFICVIAILLYVFKLNRDFISAAMDGKSPEEGLMRFLDRVVRVLFFIGVISTALFAFNIAKNDLEKHLQKTSLGAVDEHKNQSGKEPSGSAANDSQRQPSGSTQPSANDLSDPEPTIGSTKPAIKQ